MRSQSLVFRMALPIIVLITLESCGARNGHTSVLPEGISRSTAAGAQAFPTTSPIPINDPQKADHPGARMSSRSSPFSFASAVGKSLSIAEIDHFIDPSVTGADRALAEQLMESMPSNMRGDFVYIREKRYDSVKSTAICAVRGAGKLCLTWRSAVEFAKRENT